MTPSLPDTIPDIKPASNPAPENPGQTKSSQVKVSPA